MNDWKMETAIKFKHSDKDVYDDPYFTVSVEVPDNCYWKVVPKSSLGNWDGSIWGVAVDGDESTEGKLINKGAQAAKIAKGGWYRFTINMMENEYKVDIRLEELPYEYIRWIENEDIDLNRLVGTSDMKKIRDLKGRPLLLFINSWSVGMVLDRNEGLVLSEFGR